MCLTLIRDVHVRTDHAVIPAADDEDEFFDAQSRAGMSRQSSLGSSLPSPQHSQLTSTSDRGALLNTRRAESSAVQMGDEPVEVASQAGESKPIQAPDTVVTPSKHNKGAILSLPEDLAADPLESGAFLDISRLDEAAADVASGTAFPTTSQACPLSSPLLQVSPDPSLDPERSGTDPFVHPSPEPVLLSDVQSSCATPAAVPHVSTGSSPESGASQVHKLHDDERRNGYVGLEQGGTVGRSHTVDNADRGPSPVQSLSNTLADVQADQAGGLFGGLEMEDYVQPLGADAADSSAATCKAVEASTTGVADIPAALSASDGANATGQDDTSSQAPCSRVHGAVRPVDAVEDVVQPLPISKPVRFRLFMPTLDSACVLQHCTFAMAFAGVLILTCKRRSRSAPGDTRQASAEHRTLDDR